MWVPHSLRRLHEIFPALQAGDGAVREEVVGLAVVLREPAGQDPLGGVVDVRGPFGLVQIVKYGGRLPAVIGGGLASADTAIHAGSRLRIVALPHLVALKL